MRVVIDHADLREGHVELQASVDRIAACAGDAATAVGTWNRCLSGMNSHYDEHTQIAEGDRVAALIITSGGSNINGSSSRYRNGIRRRRTGHGTTDADVDRCAAARRTAGMPATARIRPQHLQGTSAMVATRRVFAQWNFRQAADCS